MAGLQLRRKLLICLLLGLHAFLCISAPGEEHSFVKEAKNGEWKKCGYDYIVVGGGTAGCTIAATLSQNMSVLLLERGGSPFGNQNISNIENFEANLYDNASNRSTTQLFISQDGVINARARVLGGGTCLNAGFYTRASTSQVKAMGLEGGEVEASYRWVESVVAHRPTPNEWQNAVAKGLIEAGISPYNGFTYHHIPGTKFGGTTFNQSGDRSTAADILLQRANPTKLEVLLHATVQRLLFDAKGERRPKVKGVVFTDGDGRERKVYLKDGKSEVIICGGALGSPQLLMLSGIGPADELKSMGIKVVMDQPAVGKGMADNPMNTILIPLATPVPVSLIQAVGITKFGSYIETCSGFRLFGKSLSNKDGIILQKVKGPLSRGYLRLNSSSNAEDNPIVKFNYYDHSKDLEMCVKGIRTIQKIIQSNPMKKFISPSTSLTKIMNSSFETPVNLIPRNTSEGWGGSLEQFCKETVTTIWHYHGGCQVGSVVDGEYKIVGVDGARVIDGSTFLFSPGTNPQATVMMLGRYMGVRILRERLGPSAGV